jgi:hypothetical protein
VECLTLDDPQLDLRWACDVDLWPCSLEQPAAGEGFFYLLRIVGESSYGRTSELEQRTAGGGCP